MGTYRLSVTVQSAPAGSDEYPASTETTGTVLIGDSKTGEIDFNGDRDWFAVELEAGTQYQVDLEGSQTGDGTLWDPYLRKIVNADGEYQSGTYNDDYAGSRNSRVHFTPEESGRYYVEASGDRHWTGTYTLSVEEIDGI